MNKNLSTFLAEFIGTYLLVFVGTGAIVLNDFTDGKVTHLGISLAFGIIVFLMILVFGKTSGANINPAVTIALVVGKEFSTQQLLSYLIAQFSGGIVASVSLQMMFQNAISLGETLPKAGVLNTFLVEFVLSFFLMASILYFSILKQKNVLLVAFIVGFVVFLEAFWAGPFTGASMNPARSLAPALISGNYSDVWIYLLSTTFGMVTAMILFLNFRKNSNL